MRAGRLIGVVGPSGVGKDSVMAAVAARQPGLRLVRRVITRTASAGGEDFEGVDPARFAELQAQGAFALSWQAHGLHYGIPVEVDRTLAAGNDAMVNLSRAVLDRAMRRFARFTVINLTARAETLAARLAGRGRETAEDIARRLQRDAPAWPPGLTVATLENDNALDATVDAVRHLLYPETV